jgi:DNA processing protein
LGRVNFDYLERGKIGMERELFKYWIGAFSNFRADKIQAIIEYFTSPKEAFYGTDGDLKDMRRVCQEKGIKFTDRDIEKIKSSRDIELLKINYDYICNHQINYVTMLDGLYPDKLRHIYDPPFLLYYKGKELDNNRKFISIVGARECSVYGRESAKYLAGAIALEGITIISGLARGIDSYAHMGALSVQGSTYGIMGCGIDVCYPVENLNLYMEMQSNGGIISEYGPGVKPLPYHFPMRNRIISGLCDGILVIEAKEKSGSLITVDLGLEQGKNIYALPGRITDKLSGGCNNLIKMGAKLVTRPQDILEDFIDYTDDSEQDRLMLCKILNKDELIIYENLSLSPIHIEELVILTGLKISKIMESLLSLELKDIIDQPMKNYYTKRYISS